MAELVSIVMCIYNRQDYVGAAIESAMAQTYQPLEIILWDDGSTDQSLAIALSYAQRDERIRLIDGEHQGLVSTLADAVALARGAYVGWLDSDDLLTPDAVAQTAAVLDAQPQVGLVYTDYLEMDAAGTLGHRGSRCSIPYSPQRMLTDFMTYHFRLYRRSIAEQVGYFDRTIPCAPDHDFCLRMSEVTRIYHLRRVLYHYRIHDGRMSSYDRMGQIESSRRVVEQAMIRRGMMDQFELKVDIQPRFRIVRKSNPAG
jgi:glycosyltransferase involved in cell wall biosynthesis